MNINRVHALLGHGDDTSTRLTAKELGWTITRGKMKPCEYCACSKAKQKNVSKEPSTEKFKKAGERVYLDLTKVTVPNEDGSESTIRRKNWEVIVDEATGKKWFSFHDSKNGMIEPTCELFNILKSKGVPVKVVRLDPAGENLKIEKQAQSADWSALQPIDFKFTSRDTPQQNSLAELAFPNLAGKSPAMMSACHCPDGVSPKIALECIRMATMLDGLKEVQVGDVVATRDMHVYGSNPTVPELEDFWGSRCREGCKECKDWESRSNNDVCRIPRQSGTQ